MAVKIKGGFSKFVARISTGFPLDWGNVSSDTSGWMDFQRIGEHTKTKSLDFGPLTPNIPKTNIEGNS